jgi:hypothetical protein
MTVISNSASNPELNRGLASLYAQLREDIQKNDGDIRSGFEKSFTSADGLVTITLSTQGLAAYEGAKAGDIGIHVKKVSRSGTDADAATSEGNALSDPLRSIDDVKAHETLIKQHFTGNAFNTEDLEPLPQPSESLEQTANAGISLDTPNALQSKQQATNRLIDTLTAFLQSLNGQKQGSLTSLLDKPSSPDSTSSSSDARQRSQSSLFIRIDVKA